MQTAHQVERWIERFPLVRSFSASHLQIARGTVHFPVLEAGAIAYELQAACANYLMCIDGRTRVFRMNAAPSVRRPSLQRPTPCRQRLGVRGSSGARLGRRRAARCSFALSLVHPRSRSAL